MPHVSISSEIRLWGKLGEVLEQDRYAAALYLMLLPHGADGTLLPMTPRGIWALAAPAALIPLEETAEAVALLLESGLLEETENGLKLIHCRYWKPDTKQRRNVNRSRRERIIERDGQRCFYCERDVPWDDIEVDHKIPVSRGGANTSDNLVVACRACNQAKGAMTDAEFVAQEVSE